MARSWTLFGVGLWAMISPWLLGFSEIELAKWSNVLIGLVLVLTSGWDIFGAKEIGERSK